MTTSKINYANRTVQGAWKKLWIVERFIMFGVGGFLLLMISWLALVLRFSSPPETIANPFLAFLLALFGALMMLFGVGEWGRWAYLWVFVSTPLMVSLFLVIPWPKWLANLNLGGKETGVLLFALPFVVSYFAVRRYYRRLDAKEWQPMRDSAAVTSGTRQGEND